MCSPVRTEIGGYMNKGRIDYGVLIYTLFLVAFGVLMVFSSSYYWAIDSMQNKTHFFVQEVKWVVAGVAAMLFASMVPYKFYKRIAPYLFALSLFLLVFVLFKGRVINNARRWIYIGGQGFMPAEVSKIASIMFFAFMLEKNKHRLNHIGILSVYIGLMGIQFYLIMKQPNMSTATILIGITGSILFVAGLSWRYIVPVIISGIGIFWYFVNSADYRLDRWMSFIDPFKYKNDEAWQVIQSLYALGTGGVRGVGIGLSTQNKLYIPEPQNDFILATIGEELGLIGTVGLLIVFLLLVYRCVKIAMNAPDTFSILMATGIIAMISLQFIMNYAVATSSMPATGVTLPFISYGGSSLVMTMGAVGILLNISKYTIQNTDGDKK